MNTVVAAEAVDLAVPLYGTQTLHAGFPEQILAQGKAASPGQYMHFISNLHRDFQQLAHLPASLFAMRVLLSIMRTSHMMLCDEQRAHYKGQQRCC